MFIIKTFNMALARLCVTFFLLVYLEVTCENQQGLSNVATGLCLNNKLAGAAQQILQRRAALLSESQNCNQNTNGNVGTIAVQQSQNNQASNVQGNPQGNFQANNQLGNSQQQRILQQAINTLLPLNLQQPASNQNQHQVYLNQNSQYPQAQNIQLSGMPNTQKQCFPNQNQQISVNPSYQQSKNSQQNNNLQSQVVQQQQTSTLLNNNPQILGQSVLPQSDIGSPSMVNRQMAGLPAQISQGTLLSHLGIQSSLPTLLPNFFGSTQSVNQASLVQNNLENNAKSSNQQTNQPQTSVQPLSTSSQQFQLMQNPQGSFGPAQNQFNQYNPNMQQQFVPVQNQPIIGVSQSQSMPYSVQGQSVTTSLQSQPMQPKASVPCQSAPQAQNQLIYPSVPIQNNPMMQYQLSPVPTSQYPQSPNGTPQHPNNLPGFQNNGVNSKSSNMKQLLPLLLNLLKEKSCCACCPNQNCGCMNNNPIFRNQSPQVVGGYSQYVKNVPAVVNTAANMIDSDEEDEDDTVWRLKKYKNYNETKTRHDDSAEEDDDEDSAEVGKDDEHDNN